jgi:hypothetical protein
MIDENLDLHRERSHYFEINWTTGILSMIGSLLEFSLALFMITSKYLKGKHPYKLYAIEMILHSSASTLTIFH